MGDASDDVYRDADHEKEVRYTLRSLCDRKKSAAFTCQWVFNDDGLYECRTCGKVADL